MSAGVSMTGLSAAVLVPWLLGGLWAAVLLHRAGSFRVSLALGHGYFLGLASVALLLRFWDALGLPLSFWPMVGLLLLMSVPAVVLLLGTERQPGLRLPRLPPLRWLALALLLCLLGWRYIGLVQELVSRPLFAWDAFMNWAPKAIVWFQLGELVSFVPPAEWLQQEGAYTLGNRRANLYPEVVPLIQLWHMLGADTWDGGGVYLAWLLAPLAVGAALFGHLRQARVSVPLSALAVYSLLSLPYVNVHAVLAGYADLWLAAVFGLAVFSLYEWRRTKDTLWLMLWVLYALLCTQLKNPGIVLGLVVLIAGALGALPPARRLLLVGAGGAVLALLLLVGLDLDLPLLGRVVIASDALQLGRFGPYVLAYQPTWDAFASSLWVMLNWHLLGYLAPLGVLYALYRNRGVRVPEAELLALLGAATFLALVFNFTSHSVVAENFVTLNRALLYLVPAGVFCLFLLLRRRAQP